ncbi:hypothetical protein ACSAZL_21970 [Methanosarcina sp. T3]
MSSNMKILTFDYGCVQKAYVLEFIRIVWGACIEGTTPLEL